MFIVIVIVALVMYIDWERNSRLRLLTGALKSYPSKKYIWIKLPSLCIQTQGQWNESIPGNIYLFKVKNRNTRKRREICSKLTRKTPERHHLRRFGVFIVNFKKISHLFSMCFYCQLWTEMLAGLLQ